MADGTLQNATDKISTDELVTLNGAAAPAGGEKVQRQKVGFGSDSILRDVSGAYPLPVDTDSKRVITFNGRVSSYRMPGRAGTTGQKLFSIFNAAGSAVIVDIEKLSIDYYATAAKVVATPIVRVVRITAEPTNGTALTNKVSRDTAQSSSASVTARGDASADGTSSASALTHAHAVGTITNVFTQMYSPRNLTLVGYEPWDRQEFMDQEDEKLTLRASEGLLVFLDYNTATFNPITDMYLVNCKWTEYTLAT